MTDNDPKTQQLPNVMKSQILHVESISFSSRPVKGAPEGHEFGKDAELNIIKQPATGELEIDEYMNLTGKIRILGTISGKVAGDHALQLAEDFKKYGMFNVGSDTSSILVTRDLQFKVGQYRVKSDYINWKIIVRENNPNTGLEAFLEIHCKDLPEKSFHI